MDETLALRVKKQLNCIADPATNCIRTGVVKYVSILLAEVMYVADLTNKMEEQRKRVFQRIDALVELLSN